MSHGDASRKPAIKQSPCSDVLNLSSTHARHDEEQGGLARAVETEHADLGAVVEAERRLRVAQDLLVGRDDTSHFVHGVNYKGFV